LFLLGCQSLLFFLSLDIVLVDRFSELFEFFLEMDSLPFFLMEHSCGCITNTPSNTSQKDSNNLRFCGDWLVFYKKDNKMRCESLGFILFYFFDKVDRVYYNAQTL